MCPRLAANHTPHIGNLRVRRERPAPLRVLGVTVRRGEFERDFAHSVSALPELHHDNLGEANADTGDLDRHQLDPCRVKTLRANFAQLFL